MVRTILAAILSAAVHTSDASAVAPSTELNPPWPHGRVPVQFAAGFSPAEQRAVMTQFGRFGPLVSAYLDPQCRAGRCLRVVRGMYCAATRGMTAAPRMQLSDACIRSHQHLAHEVGHVLGLGHPHQSPDRCGWIGFVDYDAIAWAALGAYSIQPASRYSPPSSSRSVMTYRPADLSRTGESVHGGRTASDITRHDVAAVTALYSAEWQPDPIPALPDVSLRRNDGVVTVTILDYWADVAVGPGRVDCGDVHDWIPIESLPGWQWARSGWSLSATGEQLAQWAAGGRMLHVRGGWSVYARDDRAAVVRAL